MLQRKKCILLCSILMFGVLVPSGFAAPRLKIEPPAEQISVDQRVTLTVQLEWPRTEGLYEINSLEPKLENLTLEKQYQTQETGATVSHILNYEFRPLKKGIAVIYAFEVTYRKSETEPWIPVLVPEQKIRVVPSSPVKTILVWLAILGGSAGLIFAGVKTVRALKAQRAAKNVPPADPKQRIYAKAEESVATFNSPSAKEKLTHWSNQLRTVLLTYYELSSKITTANEILSCLKSKGLPAGEWNEVSRLLEQLIEMQFSRQDISTYDLDRMQKTLLQYIKGKIIIGTSNS